MEENFLKVIEILGLITGILYVIGAIFEKKWCWYFGILAVIFYGISTYFYNLYGEFALQFFYLGISFYGLNQWSKNIDTKTKTKTELHINFSSFEFLFKNILVGIILSIIIYYVLVYFKSSYPFWDAITSAFGIVATYMTTQKKIENWILWIVIDTILAYILYLKEMPFYAILYLVYFIFAIVGFLNWKKEMNTQKNAKF